MNGLKHGMGSIHSNIGAIMNKTSAYGFISTVSGVITILSGFTFDCYFNNAKPSIVGNASIVIGATLLALGTFLSMLGLILERNKARLSKDDIKKFIRGNN